MEPCRDGSVARIWNEGTDAHNELVCQSVHQHHEPDEGTRNAPQANLFNTAIRLGGPSSLTFSPLSIFSATLPVNGLDPAPFGFVFAWPPPPRVGVMPITWDLVDAAAVFSSTWGEEANAGLGCNGNLCSRNCRTESAPRVCKNGVTRLVPFAADPDISFSCDTSLEEDVAHGPILTKTESQSRMGKS